MGRQEREPERVGKIRNVLGIARRGDDYDYSRKQENHCGREQAVPAKGVEQKRLHIKEPERAREHRQHRKGKESWGPRVTESCEGRKAECGEIRRSSESGDGDSADFRIRTAQNTEAIRRSAAHGGFASEINYG